MITYNSNNYNTLIDKIIGILKDNNVDTTDEETNLPHEVIESITSIVKSFIVSVDKFVAVPCPKCELTHLQPMQSTYQRNIIFKIDNILIKIKIPVSRLKCSNCGTTHAVLPDFCVPFKQYSEQAILEIASEASASSTEVVANNLNLDSKQIRRFVNVVKSFKNDILLLSNKFPTVFQYPIDNTAKLHDIIAALPSNFDELYFREFRNVVLYIKTERKIYIKYHILSL